jgi:hypothetical protein
MQPFRTFALSVVCLRFNQARVPASGRQAWIAQEGVALLPRLPVTAFAVFNPWFDFLVASLCERKNCFSLVLIDCSLIYLGRI